VTDIVAQRGQPVHDGVRAPLYYETLTLNDGGVHGLVHVADAEAAGYPPLRVRISVRCPTNTATGGAAWRADGEAPTATDGMPMEHGKDLDLDIDPADLQFIRLTADVTVVHVHYFY
jgi:hypothetical protein